jgi:hypothetical protein
MTKRARPIFRLRKEATGFYRSADGRFSAQKKKRRRWQASDKMQPLRMAYCKTLRQCRAWFLAAQKIMTPSLDLEIPEPKLRRFF